MSAYVVDRNHIRYLVAAAAGKMGRVNDLRWVHDGTWHKLSDGEDEKAAQVGQMLWNENIRSVTNRYPDCEGKPANLPGPTDEVFIYDTHKEWNDPLNAVQVLSSCACYSYQSCEHEGWKTSEAAAFIDALERKAIHALPGMEDALWGAPEPTQDHVIRLSSLMK